MQLEKNPTPSHRGPLQNTCTCHTNVYTGLSILFCFVCVAMRYVAGLGGKGAYCFHAIVMVRDCEL